MTDVAFGVRPATVDDALAVAQSLAAAFGSGPLAHWLIPDPVFRQAVYHEYSRVGFGHAITHGQVDTVAGCAGAAIWFAYPGTLPEGSGDLSLLLGCAAARFQQLDEAMAARVPALAHHHLAYLGVRPEHQCLGIGSALLRHHHARLDAAGVPAFLFATSERGRELYLRHGYVVVEEFWLPDGPPLWAMWREPR